jgi:eukaryotic-like serine/threonine-protein kinase
VYAARRPASVTEILKILEAVEKEQLELLAPTASQQLGTEASSRASTNAEDIYYNHTWPKDKPRAEIVFPQLIVQDGNEVATLWIMLSREDIEKYKQNKPHSQFLLLLRHIQCCCG